MHFRLKYHLLAGHWGIVALVLSACAGQMAATSPATVESISTITPLPVAQESTAVPIQRPTLSEPVELVVWWPEPLVPVENGLANDLLSSQIEAFEQVEQDSGGVLIDRRMKKAGDVGGIMSTLRSASNVAPGALPDLTLLRREDLLAAASSGLIQPLEGQISIATLGELTGLSGSILELGQVDGQLYGVPYMLEILLVAYRPPEPLTTYDSWRFEDMLTREQPFVFPAGSAAPLNNTFYVQYLSAGGTPPQNGVLTVNENALLTVLNFYQQAYETGVVSGTLVNYISPADYQLQLVNSTIDTAVLTSTTFLALHTQPSDLLAAPLPTHSGQMATQLDGWMWVMPTADVDSQAQAVRFLEWMMDAERQEPYARSIHMLPSQRSALRTWDSAQLDSSIITEFLTNAYLPLSSGDSGAVVRAMQNALVAVITGVRTAEEATQDVLNQAAS